MPHCGPQGPTLSSDILPPTRRMVLAGIAVGAVGAALKVPPAIARSPDLPTTIAEAGKRFRSGSLTSLDLTKAYLAVQRDPALRIQSDTRRSVSQHC
jgi:hypothetical protein